MRKTLLIVEDQKINIQILSKVLGSEYRLFTAENGQEALEILRCYGNEISCILLDIIMPVMDGYEFMEKIKKTEYQNIPIIVMTGNDSKEEERKVLNAGAWDFVRKPYEKEIVWSRIHNAISRSQTELLERLKYVTTHDSLTGLYNRTFMFKETRRLLELHPQEQFAFVRFDLERFHLINSFYGEEFGNKVLLFITETLTKFVKQQKYCVYGRVDADVFCVCLPYGENDVTKVVLNIKKDLIAFQRGVLLEPAIGVYVINDSKLPIETMYARASMAAQECKKSFSTDFVYYDDTMTNSLNRAQEIMSEMNKALNEGQFEIYLQPKYNLKTEGICGAEALVRWLHPIKGLISPSDFIPIFEQNGFITKLDFYVWNKTCQLIKKWLDDGKKPNPISVNISRVDMYNPQIVRQIENLVRSHEIPFELFNLELTESAYMDNPELMKKNVDSLQKCGFKVLMDDFGSGYSSLNTLKDIPVDILKIDLKFLQKSIEEGRSEKILASIIRMANWLSLPVIVEGVETEQQRDFLLSIGCEYVQGYYYAKPMPISEYEILVSNNRKKVKRRKRQVYNEELLDSIWNANHQVDLLFKSMRQPVVIFEEIDGQFTMLRVNEAYTRTFDLENLHKNLIIDKSVSAYEKDSFYESLHEAYATCKISECEIHRYNSKMEKRCYQLESKFIGCKGISKIFFTTMMDVTEQRQLEYELSTYQYLLDRKSCKNKMLIVEDSEVGRAILTEAFKDEYAIISADNGKRGIELFIENQEQLAIILLDIEMPIMDGREFLRKKREIANAEDVPVIIISCDDSADEQRNMLKLGVNDYVIKPFIPEVMVRRVKNVLEYQHTFKLLSKEYNNDTNKQ